MTTSASSVTACCTPIPKNIPLAILNLDQKHIIPFLLATNYKGIWVFGDNFISYIKFLYNNTESLVKVSSSLTSPFSFRERASDKVAPPPPRPALFHRHRNFYFTPFEIKWTTWGSPYPIVAKHLVVTAYADDITIFIGSERGFQVVSKVYDMLTAGASAAILSLPKSQGLWGLAHGSPERTGP